MADLLHRLRGGAVMAAPLCTKQQAIAAAAQVLANARAHMATLTDQQAAAEAYVPGEDHAAKVAKIRRLRAQTVRVAA